MRARFRPWIVAWMVASLAGAGCTSVRPLADTRPQTVRVAVHVGDEVELTTRGTGQVFLVRVSRVEATYLAGYQGTLYVKAPYADLAQIRMSEVDGRKVGYIGGAVLGGTVLVAGVIVLFVVLFRHAVDRALGG